MDLFPFKFRASGPPVVVAVMVALGLAVNVAFDMLLAFLLVYAAAKGWAAA